MNNRIQQARRSLVLAALAAVSGVAQAQQNITKVVVPFPAGGLADQVARLITEHWARQAGQTIIVENRPGAGSRLGIDAVMKAPADGSTLLFTNPSYSILPIVDPTVTFDPSKALAPVSMIARYGLLVITRKDSPATTLPEFVALAKKNPGKLSYGSAGVGSGTHFAGEHFKSLTGTFIVHIPYRSTTAATNDVAAGLVDLAFDAAAKPLIDAGRVKLLAVTGHQRDPRFPNVPTAAETGLKPFVHDSWVGFLAPAATPQPVIERLNKAISAALDEPAVHKRLAEMGLSPQGGPAALFAGAIREDVLLYRKIVTDSKLKFD